MGGVYPCYRRQPSWCAQTHLHSFSTCMSVVNFIPWVLYALGSSSLYADRLSRSLCVSLAGQDALENFLNSRNNILLKIIAELLKLAICLFRTTVRISN